ncbi:ribonucleoside-diphosphate reductase large subunit [Raphidocelis subcapitata]|uniref:Ribonucleoside-diphosphate reductase large subunit n=1 Tax=Raphidocelis subcapitata TaxID=307507 RepID=A0A2V0NQA4_9CHLO|nr:ribonucleoside-diphosphate reductase large subunit [Raphidocelis subcapitata]|eukprot:GBF88772.1 ribonucleoside-diphosphate reductase large subunit [Raphidocelis subcapitata]
MFVVKRDGRQITARIARLATGLHDSCDPVLVAQKVAAGVHPGVATRALDELAAETAAALTSAHPDYGRLAARIAVSSLHKDTLASFSQTVALMWRHANPGNGEPAPLVSEQLAEVVREGYAYDYFGFKTLERSYLLRMAGRAVERPQHMLMRVAATPVGIHGPDVPAALETDP